MDFAFRVVHHDRILWVLHALVFVARVADITITSALMFVDMYVVLLEVILINIFTHIENFRMSRLEINVLKMDCRICQAPLRISTPGKYININVKTNY